MVSVRGGQGPAAVAALAVLLSYEPRRAEPIVDFRFFRSVPFAGANLSAVCAIAAAR